MFTGERSRFPICPVGGLRTYLWCGFRIGPDRYELLKLVERIEKLVGTWAGAEWAIREAFRMSQIR